MSARRTSGSEPDDKTTCCPSEETTPQLKSLGSPSKSAGRSSWSLLIAPVRVSRPLYGSTDIPCDRGRGAVHTSRRSHTRGRKVPRNRLDHGVRGGKPLLTDCLKPAGGAAAGQRQRPQATAETEMFSDLPTCAALRATLPDLKMLCRSRWTGTSPHQERRRR